MVVIDTSVAYKFFTSEEDQEQALNILKKHKEGEETIIIPDLLLYEIANAWSTKTSISSSQIATNLNDLKDANFKIETVSFELIYESIKLSIEYKISVYDACYAALAKKNDCDLITADNKFADKVNLLSFVKKLSEYE